MRRKSYPKLTYERAEIAAQFYMWLSRQRCPVQRIVDYTTSSQAKGYKKVNQEVTRMIDDGVLGCRYVGDAGKVVWRNG